MEKKYKLDRNIRQCLTYCIKKGGPFRWSSVLGYSKEEVLKHIEEQFEDGMTWDNYGEWVISFRIAKRCYHFEKTTDEDFKRFWSLKNIAPKWLKDAQHQKKQISKKIVEKYGLWNILPTGNIANMLVE